MALSVAASIQTPPTSMFFDMDQKPKTEVEKNEQRQRVFDGLRDLVECKAVDGQYPSDAWNKPSDPSSPTAQRPGFGRRISRTVGVGVPRSTTFRRQEEEQRKNLEPVVPRAKEKRQVSKGRQRAMSAQPVPPKSLRRQGSAPEVGDYTSHAYPSIETRMQDASSMDPFQPRPSRAPSEQLPLCPPPRPSAPSSAHASAQNLDTAVTEASYDDIVDEEIRDELERKWILNLSMHFRDKSPREKFFLTYAETPQKWRRVTISIDYRDAPPDSLEADLQALTSQRDKSARIYESIRMSLPDIQFYDTVTNLKLETKDNRLHVHVTEDVNEIVPYPSVRAVQHIPSHYCESDLHFVEHMSGFVYKVDVGRHTWIKKEIPGPDSVDEFLYEINALSELVGSRNVIELKGLVINDERTLVKGLLIGYADKGALVDVIYDNRGQTSWRRRERWAKQIVRGLSEIHEAGFVQGDFTLSNIVIDARDKAKIIDINRRGCPVGWEPPEIGQLIESGQRISMFIGVKSDIFQLGMVLWALAMEEDEPERQARPLLSHQLPEETPDYYRDLLAICLSSKPTDRLSCKDLLRHFPATRQDEESPPAFLNLTGLNDALRTTDRPDPSIQELDFGDASNVDLPAVKAKKYEALGLQVNTDASKNVIELDEYGLIPQNSIEFSPFEELNADPMEYDRGRHPFMDERHVSVSTENISPGASERATPNIVPLSPTGDRKWAEITLGGTPYLVRRDTLESLEEDHDFELEADDQTPCKPSKALQTHHPRVRDLEHVDSGLADMDSGAGVPRRAGDVQIGPWRAELDDAIQDAMTVKASSDSSAEVTQKQIGTDNEVGREYEKTQQHPAKIATNDHGTNGDDRNVDMGL